MMAPGKGLSCTQTGIRAFNLLRSFPEASSLSWKGKRGQGFLPQWPGNLRNGESTSLFEALVSLLFSLMLLRFSCFSVELDMYFYSLFFTIFFLTWLYQVLVMAGGVFYLHGGTWYL